MNSRSSLRAWLLAAAVSIAPASQAATLSWDANGATAGTGGTGTWGSAGLWTADGITFVSWTSATDTAVLGGTAGTIRGWRQRRRWWRR